MAKQEERWLKLFDKMEAHDDKLERVLANTTGNQMMSKMDFRGLNFDDLIGRLDYFPSISPPHIFFCHTKNRDHFFIYSLLFSPMEPDYNHLIRTP